MSKAVMTIHGFLTVKEDFGRLYDYLDCYDEVLAVELPGHNGEVDFDKFTLDSTKQVVLSAYDGLRAKYDEVDVIGFSMGGTLTTWLCAERDVHRAAMVAPANRYVNVMMPFEALKFYGGLKIGTFFKTKGSLKDKRNAVKEIFAPYSQNIATTNKIAKERTFKYMNPHTFGVFRDIISMANKSVEEHSPVNTPSLVLWGKLDELVPERAMKFVQKHFPNAQSIVYPDVGHAILATHRDSDAIREIMKFLTDGDFDTEVPPRESQ